MNELVQEIKDKQIIYIGEFHNRYSHHLLQLELISELHRQNKKLAIGMEMFQSRFQDIIDKYLDSRITEEQFIEQTEYKKRWGYDYSHYKPLMDFLKKQKIPVIALNMDTEIIKQVGDRKLSSLSKKVLNKLPDDIDLSNKDYKRMLFGIYSEHPGLMKNSFSKFFNAQIIRDEGMAERIACFLSEHPDYQIVVLAGNGHVMYSHGIPSRTYNRNGIEYATIVSDLKFRRDIADYVINTESGTSDKKDSIEEI